MGNLRIAVVGAGVIGQTHISTILKTDGFDLVGISDPFPAAKDLAEKLNVPYFASSEDMLATTKLDGVIVATPNELHVSVAKLFMEKNIPVLIEKPIADSLDEAKILINLERETGVPILVGHHRRHNPVIRAAQSAIAQGIIGDLATANIIYSVYKNAGYHTAWRISPGVGGPFLINVIHEIDLLRFLFGDITEVSSFQTNKHRNLAVEDTGVSILKFANGGLGTIAASDSAAAPWAWDITSGDNGSRFPTNAAQSHFFSGTKGGLSLPDLALWTYDGEQSWNNPMQKTHVAAGNEDAYVQQILHFGDVIMGKTKPIVSALEATKNLATIQAMSLSNQTGKHVSVDLDF